jgi:hypothetical protein
MKWPYKVLTEEIPRRERCQQHILYCQLLTVGVCCAHNGVGLFTYLLIYLLTYLLTYLLIYLLTYLLTYLFTYLFTYLLIYLLT